MTGVAFKEWAAVCQLLATGRQALILRKGGIHEESGLFRPDHDRFWLYPTQFHETQQQGLKPASQPSAESVARHRTAAGVALWAIADVHAVYQLETLDQALALDAYHGWTAETVTQRYHYRKPGLFALVVRVYTLSEPWIIVETPQYAGCKSWVPLDSVAPDGVESEALPAMDDAGFAAVTTVVAAALS